MTIEQVTTFSSEISEAIKRLAAQIGDNYKPLTDEDIIEMIASPTTYIMLAKAENGSIAGMITVLVYRIPYVKKASFEDFIVDTSYRGQGIGSQLVEKAVAFAKEKGAAYIDFTSRPRRVDGNKLYEKLGFKKRETNVYRFVIDYAEV